MTPHVDAHKDLHSEQGAPRGEHPGRSRNPLIKVRDLAWLEFEKPDLVRAEAFARAFGFTTVLHAARRASPSRNGRRLDVRDRPPRNADAVRRPSVRRTGHGRRRAASQRDWEDDPHAARGHRRRRGGTDRSQRDSGSRRRRNARVGRAARTTAAHLQLRARAVPHQRHPAPAARTRAGCRGWGMSYCRAPSTSRHWTGTSTTSG